MTAQEKTDRINNIVKNIYEAIVAMNLDQLHLFSCDCVDHSYSLKAKTDPDFYPPLKDAKKSLSRDDLTSAAYWGIRYIAACANIWYLESDGVDYLDAYIEALEWQLAQARKMVGTEVEG